ncbi:conserved hypothetical protein [Desulfamplus magnetovallimortis]|uniref:SCP2 domain-containing protein n=1 Tax=Desulfamplus magnetovallimortis TaxID=1246637 RepID=A0A1W1H5X1_9BACT|nr:hypothetical protein [Desulfamplus magnetovallimortis]SLM27881.1 conserved hypothetical protein [Desulfamplus magnetovallimortis]
MEQQFQEIKPRKNIWKPIYLKSMLWFTGRAVQAASRVDPEVKAEFEAMPEGYTFALGAWPSGPYMVIERQSDGTAKYMGSSTENIKIDLSLLFKSSEHLFLAFTFRESTPIATARDRLLVDGDIPHACAAVRILDIVQVYLLPKLIAKLAIKRYPRWSFKRHTIYRALVNLRAIAGV